MPDDINRDSSKIVHPNDSSSKSDDIPASEQSDLAAINRNLVERIQQAETPEEILEYLKLRDYVQN